MGNRAVIAFNTTANAPCIYLHWNGGRASVEAFLRASRELNHTRFFDGHPGNYERQAWVLDEMAQMIRLFLGGSVYRETYGTSDTDNGDNGVYIIDKELHIIGRLHAPTREEIHPEKTRSVYDDVMAAVRAMEETK